MSDPRDAEIARLRDALEQIAEMNVETKPGISDKQMADLFWHALGLCRRIARAALEAKP